MEQYVRPSVEVIEFDDDIRGDDEIISGCNCHYDITNYTGYVESTTTKCVAETGHASENPFGIPASSWTFN